MLWFSVPCVGKSTACAAWEFGTPGHCSWLLSALVLSFWAGFRPWENGANVIQHRYMLLLMKCCISSLTQKQSPLSPEALRPALLHPTSSLRALCSWVPASPGLVHGLRLKSSCPNSPAPQPCPPVHPKVSMANPGVTLPTSVIPDLPFLDSIISSPDLAETQGDRLELERNQNFVLIANICPEINVSELMFLSDQCVQKQMTLSN